MRSRRIFGIAAVMLSCALLGFFFYRRDVGVPPFEEPPLDAASRNLTNAEVNALLAQDFVIVQRVNKIPPAIKKSWANALHLPFDMNNPGDAMSTDAIVEGLPTRQLVFAGVSPDRAFIVWKQGGFADSFHVAVFSYSAQRGKWIAAAVWTC